MTLRFLLLMASLMLVDLCITGIFIAASGRLAVLGSDLIANLALLGGLNVLGAWWLFRPVQAFLAGRGSAGLARARIARLPWLASGWAVVCTIFYCIAAFSLGVFAPEMADFTTLPESTLVIGMLWYGGLYALYYSFYIFFAVSDFTNDLKQRLARDGLGFRSDRGRVLHKLVIVFVVAAFLPSILVALDLSVFRELRAAQGLTVEQTLFLDLLASAFLITVSLVFVTRSLVRPINALMVSIQQLGEGRLDVQAPVMSNDELGVLSERFNQMLEGLRDREFLRETFGRYVPQKIATALLANRGILEPQLKTATGSRRSA